MLQMPQTLKKMLLLHDCHPALMSCCSVSETNCCRCRAETLLLPMRVQLRLLNTGTALASMELMLLLSKNWSCQIVAECCRWGTGVGLLSTRRMLKSETDTEVLIVFRRVAVDVAYCRCRHMPLVASAAKVRPNCKRCGCRNVLFVKSSY